MSNNEAQKIEDEIIKLISKSDNYCITHQYYTCRDIIYYSVSGCVTRDSKLLKEFNKAIENLKTNKNIKEIESIYTDTRMFIKGENLL